MVSVSRSDPFPPHAAPELCRTQPLAAPATRRSTSFHSLPLDSKYLKTFKNSFKKIQKPIHFAFKWRWRPPSPLVHRNDLPIWCLAVPSFQPSKPRASSPSLGSIRLKVHLCKRRTSHQILSSCTRTHWNLLACRGLPSQSYISPSHVARASRKPLQSLAHPPWPLSERCPTDRPPGARISQPHDARRLRTSIDNSYIHW